MFSSAYWGWIPRKLYTVILWTSFSPKSLNAFNEVEVFTAEHAFILIPFKVTSIEIKNYHIQYW